MLLCSGFLPGLPLALLLGLAEDVGGALVEELVPPLGGERGRYPVLRRHLGEGLLALVDLKRDPHLELGVVLPSRRLAHDSKALPCLSAHLRAFGRHGSNVSRSGQPYQRVNINWLKATPISENGYRSNCLKATFARISKSAASESR